MRNYYNIYREYRRIQGNTGEYKTTQEKTKEYRKIQGNTEEYRGKQENTGESKKTQGDTSEYLTNILLNLAEYRLILSRRGRAVDRVG